MKNQNSIPTLFVAFSHTLTQSQIDGFKEQYGVYQPYVTDKGLIAPPVHKSANIVTLKDVAPELQAQMSQIPATATLVDIQSLAKAIVAEAVKAGSTHFFMVGEPTLTMWANIFANSIGEDGQIPTNPHKIWVGAPEGKSLICLQSTTERRSVDETQPDGSVKKVAIFSHVTWREMF